MEAKRRLALPKGISRFPFGCHGERQVMHGDAYAVALIYGPSNCVL